MTHHHHGSDSGNLDRRLWASAALNLGITLVELAGGIWAGSLALLADSAHNLADVGALGLAIFARRLGRRAPTPRHTYGLKRAEVVAALFNAAALIAISALIGREGVARLLHPSPVRASVMLVAAVVAFLANLGSVLLLRTHSAEDINVRSAFLHLAQDALASLAVVVAALFARTAAGRYIDPAAAILIGAVVLRSAVSIVWESLHTLLEAALKRRRGRRRSAPVHRCPAASRSRLGGGTGPAGVDRPHEGWRNDLARSRSDRRRSAQFPARRVGYYPCHTGS